MPRLMDVDVFKKNLDKEFETATDAFDAVDFALEDTPTIDAVPVVRCEDCKHYELGACLKIYQDGNISNDAWQERKPTDFCSYGEREE